MWKTERDAEMMYLVTAKHGLSNLVLSHYQVSSKKKTQWAEKFDREHFGRNKGILIRSIKFPNRLGPALLELVAVLRIQLGVAVS